MTEKQRYLCVSEAANYADRNAYISDLSLSSMWGDEETADIPAERIDALGRLWDAYHRSVADILASAGLSKMAFSRRFFIPYKSVQNWCAAGGEKRECPLYVRLMVQEILGLL